MSTALAVEPYATARQWLLGRLQDGPVRCLDLKCPPFKASANPAERVRELRKAQHDIGTMYAAGEYWYLLCVDGKPVWGRVTFLERLFLDGSYRWGVNGRPSCL